MDPLKLLFVLRARYKVALGIFMLVVATGFAANQYLPKRFAAEAIVMVDVRSPDPVAALLMPSTMGGPGSLATQVDVIRSDRVGRKVVAVLGLAQDPAVRQAWQDATGGKGKIEDWMSSALRKGIAVNPARDGSSMISISYQGADPAFVAAVANAFAQAYIDTSVELRVEPARQYSQWFAEQAKVLRETVEKAQGRLSEFQRTRGITDEAVENENAKLRELTTRLANVQGDIRDAQSRQRSRGDPMPEIAQNPGVQTLRTSITQLEVKLKESAGNLGPRHPQYQRMEAELAELKNRLDIEMERTAQLVSSSAFGRTREAEIKAAIDAQSRKILAMKKDRDELAVLSRDVETAKRAYEAVTARLTQSQLESQATRTNVSILSPALEPLEPSFPMPFRKILIIALGGGLLLALAAVMGLELIDRRVRNADDLAEMLQMPVLAVVERLPRHRYRALPLIARRPLPAP